MAETGAGAAPSRADVVETHCSTVLFTGGRAYKVKKPVDLGFVDFRSAESRRAACLREVELNRRFAPDVYLGVAEVRSPQGEPCEWVTVMRRMPADRRLSGLVRRDADVQDALRAVARLLAVHHAAAPRSTRIDRAGTAPALRQRWRRNLDGLAPFGGSMVDGAVLGEVADRALRYVDGREALLAARVAAGRIRDGHGDLLADDIFCLPDGPRVLDCEEHDDDLRAVDGIDDAACLAMDLERLGSPGRAERFLAWFAEFSGESAPPSLVHHYVAYRAVLRAVPAALRSAQGDPAGAAEARRLTEIGVRHLRAGEPTLVLVGGEPGAARSELAGGLSDALGGVLLSSDRLQQESADGLPAQTRRELLRRAGELLGYGETVVLDADWSAAAERRTARGVAAATASSVCELRCVRSAGRAARTAARAGRADGSRGPVAAAGPTAAGGEPWPEAREVQTGGPQARAVRAARTAVQEWSRRPGTPAPGGAAGSAGDG